MSALAIPKLRYPATSGTVLTLSRPIQKRWTPGRISYGGQDMSASGVPEVFIVNKFHTLAIDVRVAPSEWAGMQAFLDWWDNNAAAFDLFPRKDEGTFYPCYLVDPATGSEPDYRDDPYVSGYILTMRFRLTTGAVFLPAWP